MIDFDKVIKQRCVEMPTLEFDHCFTVMACAKSMSLSECYDYLLLTPDDLDENEQKFLELLHRRGRTVAIKEACDNLFLQMRMRGGGQTALDYLVRQSGEFTATITPSAQNGFHLNIIIPEEESK